MSDLLSASSLLMAISAILFSLWYGEISNALEIEPKEHSVDNAGYRKKVSNIIFTKALPVTIMAISISFIFLPDAIKLINEALIIFQVSGTPVFEKYDAVRTAYCFVSFVSIVLAMYMCCLTFKLSVLWKKLR